jgi:type IV pilus assembly protein PilM
VAQAAGVKGIDVAGRIAIGLDIGTSGVRAAELAFGKSGITLQKFGQVALPDGAVRDGEVIRPEVVAEAIKQLWAHTKFSSKKVIVGVANQKVIVRQVDLPWQPLDEIRESLAYSVQDTIPMPVEQAVLDFYPLDELTSEDGTRMLRGLLVAASRDMVQAQLDAVNAAGLKPDMVDLTAFAVLRSLADGDALGMGGRMEALVDVGARVTNIVVHEGGVPRFVRILLMGGADVTDALAERTGTAASQAEALKHEMGMNTGGTDMEQQAAGRVMDAAGQAFVDQVRGSLDYYMASPGARPIELIALTGGGSRLNGLADRLQTATRISVKQGSACEELSLGKTGLSPDQLKFVEPLAAVPVGLALGAAS